MNATKFELSKELIDDIGPMIIMRMVQNKLPGASGFVLYDEESEVKRGLITVVGFVAELGGVEILIESTGSVDADQMLIDSMIMRNMRLNNHLQVYTVSCGFIAGDAGDDEIKIRIIYEFK